MRAAEAEQLEAGADFRDAHEQFPQECAAMILDHRDDRALADRDVGIGIPVLLLAEAIDETKASPDTVTEIPVEVPQCGHGLLRCISEARQGSGGRDDTAIILRRVRGIAAGDVAGTQAPAIGTVVTVVVRVAYAVRVVDASVVEVLLPVVGVPVRQPAWIETAEGEMREKQRAAPGRSERQLHAFVGAPVD